MDIDEKIKKFEQSCEKLAQIDAQKLNEKLNREIEEQIESDLDEYVKKQEVSYNKQCEKVVKEYNKSLFDYELECKKNIQNVKKIINRELKEEVERRIIDFTNKDEYYMQYLMRSIDSVLKIVENNAGSIIYVTKRDSERYRELLEKYNITINYLDDFYIGGCKLINTDRGVIVDNTLKSNIEDMLNDDSFKG